MKILYIIDSLRPGGKERQAVALLRGLAAQDVRLQIVSMGTDRFFAPELERDGIRIQYVLRRTRLDLRPWRILNRIVSAFRPDVIHTTCWMTSLFAFLPCRLHHVPLVNASIQNSFASGGPRWRAERWLLQQADARIANSRAGFRSRGFDEHATGNYVIYNGFETARLNQLDPAAIAEMRKLAAGRKLVGMVAQFKPDKDYPTFLEAASRIIRQRNDVVFVAVGDGVNLNRLRARYSTHSGQIVFLGRRTHVESIANCFFLGVLATFTEGISNSIMEYMALGKPVVATDGGGTCELVVDGVSGWLVPPRDVDALAQRISYFLDRPHAAAAFGERGQARIAQLFNNDKLVQHTIAVYRDVASLPAGADSPLRRSSVVLNDTPVNDRIEGAHQ